MISCISRNDQTHEMATNRRRSRWNSSIQCRKVNCSDGFFTCDGFTIPSANNSFKEDKDNKWIKKTIEKRNEMKIHKGIEAEWRERQSTQQPFEKEKTPNRTFYSLICFLRLSQLSRHLCNMHHQFTFCAPIPPICASLQPICEFTCSDPTRFIFQLESAVILSQKLSKNILSAVEIPLNECVSDPFWMNDTDCSIGKKDAKISKIYLKLTRKYGPKILKILKKYKKDLKSVKNATKSGKNARSTENAKKMAKLTWRSTILRRATANYYSCKHYLIP